MRDKTIRREFRVVRSEIRSLRQQLWGIVVAIVLGFGALIYTNSQRQIDVVAVPVTLFESSK